LASFRKNARTTLEPSSLAKQAADGVLTASLPKMASFFQILYKECRLGSFRDPRTIACHIPVRSAKTRDGGDFGFVAQKAHRSRTWVRLAKCPRTIRVDFVPQEHRGKAN
jgi:hypothetical protein